MADVTMRCKCCKIEYLLPKRLYNQRFRDIPHNRDFCSRKCVSTFNTTAVNLPCANCGQITLRQLSHLKKIKNVFCSRSCAATYNNLHKTKGSRRSKLEVWLEEQLNIIYPDLPITYCGKAAINGELDIYIPSMKLAFELNGIYHYEPIHGEDKLTRVKNNDHRKFQACIENKIELVIIDVSQLKYFKYDNAKKYLDIITKIIKIKLSR